MRTELFFLFGSVFFFFFSFLLLRIAFSNGCDLRRIGIQKLIDSIVIIVLRIIQKGGGSDAVQWDLTIKHGRRNRVLKGHVRIIRRPHQVHLVKNTKAIVVRPWLRALQGNRVDHALHRHLRRIGRIIRCHRWWLLVLLLLLLLLLLR